MSIEPNLQKGGIFRLLSDTDVVVALENAACAKCVQSGRYVQPQSGTYQPVYNNNF